MTAPLSPSSMPVSHVTTPSSKPATPAIDPKIAKAAHDFEAMVIGQMLQPMFEAIDANGPFGGGSAEAMFRPMLVDEYAKSIAKSGGIGIADDVAREMMRMQGATQPGDEDGAGR